MTASASSITDSCSASSTLSRSWLTVRGPTTDDPDHLLDQVRHGATIFLTSHVLEVVERLCERVGIIHEGKLIAEGLMADMRGTAETLEDAFVKALGMESAAETLDWL